MSQERLNHIMVLHVHKHLTDGSVILKSAMNFQKVVAIVKPFLETFCQQTFSVIIAGTLLCSMHACYCSLDTDFFFGIMFSLKNKCSFCVLGGVFYAKSVGFWGSSPDPHGGAYGAPPYPLAGREGRPPPAPSPGDSAI